MTGGVVGVEAPAAPTVAATEVVLAVVPDEEGRDVGIGVIKAAETLLFAFAALAGMTRPVTLVLVPTTGVDATADEPVVVEVEVPREEAARRGVGAGPEGVAAEALEAVVVLIVVVEGGSFFLGEAAIVEMVLVGGAANALLERAGVMALEMGREEAGVAAEVRVGRVEERSGNETAIG